MPDGLRKRLPTKSEILSLFAVTVFTVYTWTMWLSFQKVPSCLFYLKPGEIASLYSYSFLVNFLESTLLLGICFVPCIVFPRAWWRDAFIARGVVLVVILVAPMQLHLSRFPG